MIIIAVINEMFTYAFLIFVFEILSAELMPFLTLELSEAVLMLKSATETLDFVLVEVLALEMDPLVLT